MRDKAVELLRDPEIREVVKRIIDYEEKREEEFKTNPIYEGLDMTPFWELMEIPVEWHVVKRLIFAGIVKRLTKKCYMLTDREAIKKLVEEVELVETMPKKAEEKLEEIPENLFSIVEGYDDIKKIFLKSIQLDKPVHILLVGPPATAKSLLLMEVERLSGSIMTTGSSSTKAGIRDVLVEREPKFLLIDEIEKITDTRDLSVLLTLMESGRILITKHKQYVDKPLKCWVFAAANTIKGLPRELLSRFLVFYLKPYTEEQFRRVAVKVLTERENKSRELAEYIANKVVKVLKSSDVRDCIKIARLSETREDVDFIVDTMLKYSSHKVY